MLKNRRTIRKYSSKPIDKVLLNELMTLACRTSTVGNMQVYSVVATQSEEIKAKLSPMHFNQPMVKGAPLVLTFCADFNRFTKWCEQRKATPGYNNIISFSSAAVDALIVAQRFADLAEEKGLGICYLGTTTYNANQIVEALNLPHLVFPVTTLTVGWPDEEPELTDRLPLEGILHEEVYTDYTAERIDEIYALKESLEVNKGYIKENNKETLAQVFTDVRYTQKDNEYFSTNFIETLKQQGFLEE
jgi:nitroreductase